MAYASVFLSVIPRMVVSCEHPSNETSHKSSSSTFYLLDPVYTFQRLLEPFIYQMRRIRRRLIFRGWKLVALCLILYLMHRLFLSEKLFLSPYVKVERVCIKTQVFDFSWKIGIADTQNWICLVSVCPLGNRRRVCSFVHLHLPGLQVLELRLSL